jgi:hypothetical protein
MHILCVPVVLYGSETWSLRMKEEHRLGVLLEPKRDEIIGAGETA